MLNRPRRSLPAVLALPMTMIVSSVLVSGCGADKLSDEAYGFIDLAPYYYDGSTPANPTTGLTREIGVSRGWVNGARAEYYDFGLVGVTKKRTDGKLPDYAAILPMYFFFDSSGQPLTSNPVYEKRTGLWHMRGGKAVLNPNPSDDSRESPKNVPYSVRVRKVVGDFQRPIIDRLQNSADYSGLWEIWEVTAPDDYERDSIKSYATLKQGIDAGTFSVRRTQKVINCPVIDDRQYVVPTATYYGMPHPRIELWYRTKQGSCFLADGWLTLGDASNKLHRANRDSSRRQTFDVISYTVGSGPAALTVLTAPVSKMFIPTTTITDAGLTSKSTDVRYSNESVTEALPRLTDSDPPGYRPIRWLWDLKVPQDPPFVAGSYKSTKDMDADRMANRLASNNPFTKNVPLIGVYTSCMSSADCSGLKTSPGAPPLDCSTNLMDSVSGAHCDAPLVQFGQFCGPGIAMCDAAPDPTLNKDGLGSGVLGGYTCQPNTVAGGYCFLRCDQDASAGSKATDKVAVKYKGLDEQSKTEMAEMPYDARCGNIPGYKCLVPSGSGIPNQLRVCLRACDSGKPDAFNDAFCAIPGGIAINDRVGTDFQKGMTCNGRGLSSGAGCQWDPAYEPRDPKTNFIAPAKQ